MFRRLDANEISVKVKQVTERGDKASVMLLLYKDARVDMAMLDESVGAKNWQNEYSVIKENLYCTVSIWDEDKSMWVSKSNVGTESDTEAEKGEASDAFKRACTNWGIGRELYTSPSIWVELDASETYKSNSGKVGCKTKFEVSAIEYDINGDITMLAIADSKRCVRFTYGQKKPATKNEASWAKPEAPKPEPKPEPAQTGWIAESVFTPATAFAHLTSIAPDEVVKAKLKELGATSVKTMTYRHYADALCALNLEPAK